MTSEVRHNELGSPISDCLVVDGFEVNLDQKKLKTPTGAVFRVPSEPLALMVATEWDAQHETINRHSMHLVRVLVPLSS